MAAVTATASARSTGSRSCASRSGSRQSAAPRNTTTAPLIQKTHAVAYGLFGEYYFADHFTAQIKGGGQTGESNSGAYGGGLGLTFYESPDFSIHVDSNFTAFQSGRFMRIRS